MRTLTLATVAAIAGFVACSTGDAGDLDAIRAAETDSGSTPLPGPDDSGAKNETGADEAGEEVIDCADDDDAGTEPPDTDTSKTCVAGGGAHKSMSTVDFTRAGASIAIDKLTTTVTNALQRNANKLTLSVKAKGATTYDLRVSSGPILTSGVAVSVPLPPSFVVQQGDTLRIDTVFDEGSALDPSAPCFIKL